MFLMPGWIEMRLFTIVLEDVDCIIWCDYIVRCIMWYYVRLYKYVSWYIVWYIIGIIIVVLCGKM